MYNFYMHLYNCNCTRTPTGHSQNGDVESLIRTHCFLLDRYDFIQLRACSKKFKYVNLGKITLTQKLALGLERQHQHKNSYLGSL